MTKIMTPSSRTSGQETKYRRLVEDAAKKAVDLVLGKNELDQDAFQRLLEHGNKLCSAITETIVTTTRELSLTYGKQLAEWSAFYQKHFNLALDLSGVEVLDHQPGFDHLIIVANGLTMNQVYDACVKQFPCWRYTSDLDTAVPTNDREAKHGVYTIWVRDRVEADEENKNQSANQRQEQGCTDETLLERMLHELKYWDETGKHLDVRNWTLCAGSRSSDGCVPCTRWYGGGFCVSWCSSGDYGGYLRARSVVSLPAKTRESVAGQAKR